DRCRIWDTVIVSVARGSASWTTRSATRIEYGSVNFVEGVTRPSERAPVTVTSLKVEPGSYVSVTERFRCRASGTAFERLASYPGAWAIASTAPVFGSSTIATPYLAPQCETVSRRTCSAFAW